MPNPKSDKGRRKWEQLKADQDERERKTCRHFNGLFGPGMRKDHIACKAGQDVRLHVAHNGRCNEWTCLGSDITPRCAKYEPHTAEEIAAERAETEKQFQLITTVFEHVAKVDRKINKGTMDCPACKKTLHWVRAQCNGHVHAKCTTPDCIAFMQ